MTHSRPVNVVMFDIFETGPGEIGAGWFEIPRPDITVRVDWA